MDEPPGADKPNDRVGAPVVGWVVLVLAHDHPAALPRGVGDGDGARIGGGRARPRLGGQRRLGTQGRPAQQRVGVLLRLPLNAGDDLVRTRDD